MKEEFMALGLNMHRLWGYVFLPILMKRNSDDKFYNTFHIIVPDEKDSFFSSLSNPEQELIKYSDEYSEPRLYKLFSKDKNLREFHEKVTKVKIEQFIRPYIEKRLAVIFDLAVQTDVRIFMRDKARTVVFEEDFLDLVNGKAEPVFNFNRSTGESFYSLELKLNGTIVPLLNQNGEIISDSPALLRLNNSIMAVRDIEGKKIKPFLSRNRVVIPEQTEIKYFKSFVLNIIRSFEVSAQGFHIHNRIPEKQAFISLENDLKAQKVLVLRFSYDKKKILANSPVKVFVDFHREKEAFSFDKYTRDEDFEERFHAFLKEKGLITVDGANYKIDLTTAGNGEGNFQLIEWINRHIYEINGTGLILEQKSGAVPFFLGELNLRLSAVLVQDWFDINALVTAGDFEIPFHKFRKHILNGTREYLLPDNTVLILPAEWFTRYKELLEFAKTEKHTIRLHKQHFNIVEGISSVKNHEETKKLEKLSHREDLQPASLPPGLNATLRPYQVEGFTWLLHLQQNNLGGCLADDMGLGKTLQAISILQKSKVSKRKDGVNAATGQLSLFAEPSPVTAPTSLIVVPASLVHNWVNELDKFAPALRVCTYVGLQRVKNPALFDDFDIIISSYHTVRQDIDLLSGYQFHYIILDESQVIKNAGSKVYMAMEQLTGEHRLALTGTPIENSLTDLWAQMNFVNQGLLGSLAYFKKEFVYPIEKKGETNREERLKKLIEPFILRRTKEEVAPELPAVLDQVIYCSMTDEQRQFYEKEKSGIRNYIFESIEKQGIEKSSIIVLQGLTRLRQIANHPYLVDKEYSSESGKFEEIVRNAENVIAEGHKALLFSSFVQHLNLFEREFKKRNIRYEILTGESTKRENIIKAFRQHGDCRLFLISLKAGGVGLNLTEADYVFILDPWWNPASEQQAISRSHRLGQKNNVFVYRFISENSIEEKIQKLQERKSELAATFITSNNPLKDMAREELDELFG